MFKQVAVAPYLPNLRDSGGRGDRLQDGCFSHDSGYPIRGDYDDYASQYATNVAWRERSGPDSDPFGLLMPMLGLLGDITNRRVLDAGCGEGYLARALAARGVVRARFHQPL